jgi:hypothetical protein
VMPLLGVIHRWALRGRLSERYKDHANRPAFNSE